ncbi:MAG: 2TM domain-containing protein [Acidimicrobiia bacterium]
MTRREVSLSERGRGPLWTFLEWFFGIVGGLAVFLGVFILAAGEDQYVGIGGDLSWRVGDISPGWAYGLLIGGGVVLLIALVMVIGAGRTQRAARVSDTELSRLVWHAGIFTVVNAFIWLQDIALGEGFYAYWVTIPWALGLGIHALVYYFSGEKTPVEGEVTTQSESVDQEAKDLQPH